MIADILKLFTSLGLTPTETKVYLANLELGPTSVQDIAKKARLSRTATYDAIASLQGHGLLSSFERGKKRFFAAEDPESAVAHFKGEIQNRQAHLEALTRLLPELKLKIGGERPVVRFYEGKDALHAVFHDVSNLSPKSMLELSNFEDVGSHLDAKILEDARKLLNPKHTKIRILHRGTVRVPNPDIEFCQLLPELGEFHGDIWIYENRVVFVTFIGKIVTVIIESKPFADTARVMFEAAWRICSR